MFLPHSFTSSLPQPSHTTQSTHFTMSERAWASPSTFSRSRLVVGSSSASRPQLRQKVSARARRMMMEASTWWKKREGGGGEGGGEGKEEEGKGGGEEGGGGKGEEEGKGKIELRAADRIASALTGLVLRRPPSFCHHCKQRKDGQGPA